MDDGPLLTLAQSHPLIRPALTLSQLEVTAQRHPSQDTGCSPKTLSHQFLEPAYASQGCSILAIKHQSVKPRVVSHSSWTPPSVSLQHGHLWQGRKPIFPAAVSRDIRVLSLELVISLMMQTSCQLSSNLIRLAIDWLFFPIENRGRREMLPISDQEKTEGFDLFILKLYFQSLNKLLKFSHLPSRGVLGSKTKELALNRAKRLACPSPCL